MPQRSSSAGVTMLELLVAMVAAFLVFAGIASVFISSTRGFERSESMMQLRTRLNALLDRISDDFMEAGADLPSEWNIIMPETGVNNDVRLIVNSRGARHFFTQQIDATNQISVRSATGFVGATRVTKKSGNVFTNHAINTAHNTAPFISGVDTVNNRLRFTNNVAFNMGDEIFFDDTLRYHLDAATGYFYISNLSAGDNAVHARSVDDFHISFYNRDFAPVTTWADMLVCSVFVRIRATRREKNVPGDGFRRVSGAKRFLFRNKSL